MCLWIITLCGIISISLELSSPMRVFVQPQGHCFSSSGMSYSTSIRGRCAGIGLQPFLRRVRRYGNSVVFPFCSWRLFFHLIKDERIQSFTGFQGSGPYSRTRPIEGSSTRRYRAISGPYSRTPPNTSTDRFCTLVSYRF